ncbi:MAG TPA: glycosyltransferase family 4 protein [Candidatus Saccharimonadales bacterium]|nr:glycosyltransferase family 4 protein [Candidatus Saccharimonadales bacterium]
MRVLALNWRDLKHPEAGGAEVHLQEILRRWAAGGDEVTLLSSGFPGGAPEDLQDGVRVLRAGDWWNANLALARLGRRELARGRYDLVVDDVNKIPFFAPGWTRLPVLAVVPHLFGTTVFQEAAAPMALYVWAYERFIPAVYRRARLLAISESTREDLVARGLARDRIEVVYCGMDHGLYAPGGERDPEPLVVFLGRLRRYKGVQHLLGALPRLWRQVPAARVVIVGDGPHRAALEAQAARLGSPNVSFTGSIPMAEKVRWLRRAWVTVNPSPKEGWGLTVIEANACGTPSVSSRSPGLRESVRDGETGLLVDHGDSAGLAEALARVLGDRELRERLGCAAVRWAGTFTWDRCAQEARQVAVRAAEEGA